MIRVTITTKDGLTPWLDLPDQEAVDTYIAQITASQHWGRNAWTEIVTPEIPAVLDDEGNVISEAVPAVTQDHAAEWSYITQDVTTQLAQQAAVANALDRQSVGSKIIATIFTINESKMLDGTLSVVDLQGMMQDATVSLIRELLWAGSLTTAKALITMYNGPYFTSNDKSQVLELLANY